MGGLVWPLTNSSQWTSTVVSLVFGGGGASTIGVLWHTCLCFFFSSRRRHTRYWRDWSSDVCSSDLWATEGNLGANAGLRGAWFAAPSDAMFASFRTRYRARYNANPYRLATLGYDSVLDRKSVV